MECMRAQARPRFILSYERVLGEWSQNPCELHGGNPLHWRLRGRLNPRRCIRQDSKPDALPTSYSGPTLHQAGQRARRTTNELFRPHAASSRTASPTHYQRAIPAPRCIKQDSEPDALPTSYSGPTLHQAGQRARRTTNELFRPHAASSRTASPTHYSLSYSGPSGRVILLPFT